MLTDSARRERAPRPETFLLYCCQRLLGPPLRWGRPGEAHWNCPACGKPKFHTLPHRQGQKDYYKCMRCPNQPPFWGDESNLLRLLRDYAGEEAAHGGHAEHQALLDSYRREYDRLPSAPLNSNGGRKGHGYSLHPPLTLRGKPARVYDQDPRFWTDAEYDQAAAELIELAGGDPHDAATREKLLHYAEALEVCGRYGMHPLGLAERLGFQEEGGRLEAEHMAECSDPECENSCCRRARGWTVEEIEADTLAGWRKREAKCNRHGKRNRTVPACPAPRRPTD